MLKRYTNALLQAVRALGMNPSDFTGEHNPNDSSEFIVTYEPAGLEFFVSTDPDDPHRFSYSFGQYTGSDPIEAGPFPGTGSCHFEEVLSAFDTWLTGDVRISIEEELIPDLWSQISTTSISATREDAGENFTSDERAQIKTALKTFNVLIEETFKPTEVQGDLIAEQLDYLSSALDRLNRFDWKSVAISTLVSISVALSLDTERGRELYGLFQQAFAMLMHLLR